MSTTSKVPVPSLSDVALSELLAVKVAGWMPYFPPNSGGRLLLPYKWFDHTGRPEVEVRTFATSADAVIPLLEKTRFRIDRLCKPDGYVVYIELPSGTYVKCEHPAFPRAACIVLLAAKGITEVEA